MNLCYREDSFITIIYPDYHNNPTRGIVRRYPHMTLQASGNPFGACWGLVGSALGPIAWRGYRCIPTPSQIYGNTQAKNILYGLKKYLMPSSNQKS